MTHDERTLFWDASTQAIATVRTALTAVQKSGSKPDGWTEMNIALANSVINLLNDWQGHLQNTPVDAPPVAAQPPAGQQNPNGTRSV